MLKASYYIAVHLWIQLAGSIQTCDCKYKFKRKVKLLDLDGIKTEK